MTLGTICLLRKPLRSPKSDVGKLQAASSSSSPPTDCSVRAQYKTGVSVVARLLLCSLQIQADFVMEQDCQFLMDNDPDNDLKLEYFT